MSKSDFQNGFALGLISKRQISDKLNYTVRFFADGEIYEIVKLKKGNAVRTPVTDPPNNGEFIFGGWDGSFPFTPTGDCDISALSLKLSDLLYDAFGVERSDYPYIHVYLGQTVQLNYYNFGIRFLSDARLIEDGYTSSGVGYSARLSHSKVTTEQLNDVWQIIPIIAELFSPSNTEMREFSDEDSRGGVYNYTTFECKFDDTVSIGGGHTKDTTSYEFE